MAKKKIKEGYAQIVVRLPIELRNRMNKAAEAAGCSVNSVMSAFAAKWATSIEQELTDKTKRRSDNNRG